MTSAGRRRFAVAVLAGLSLLGVSSSAFTAGRTPHAPRTAARARTIQRDTLPRVVAPYDSTVGDSISEGQLFMAWHAPYGMPGARSDLSFACGDTGRVDTLYLTFETGRNLPQFLALFARLYVRPLAGDTLGTHWRYGKDDTNNGGLLIQMGPDSTFPCAQPWGRTGMGVPRYEFSAFQGQLLMIYAVALGSGVPVRAHQRYGYARLLFKHSLCALPGARQPLCIEWFEARYSGGGRQLGITGGPGRFVTINSPGGGVCAPYRSSLRPPRWQPAAPIPAPQDTVAKAPGR
jgi:hypothetical protein